MHGESQLVFVKPREVTFRFDSQLYRYTPDITFTPQIPMAYATSTQVHGTDFSDPHTRAETLQSWHLKNPSSYHLSRAGFIATGPGDMLECYACGVRIGSWKEGQDPRKRHKEMAPDCPLSENIADSDGASVSSRTTSSSGDSGIERDINPNEKRMPTTLDIIPESSANSDLDSAVHVRSRNSARRRRAPSPPPIKYKQLEERMKTFLTADWPPNLEATPDKMAKAGFYYLGPHDRVKCGYCGGKLKKWQPKDSAIEEHVKHFPDCSFVKTIEKQTVVLSKNIRSRDKKESCMSSADLMKEMEQERENTKMLSEEEMVKKTLQRMGYESQHIRAALKQVKRKKAPISIKYLLPEIQSIEKQCHLSDTPLLFTSEDEGHSSDFEEETQLDVDERVAKVQLELKEACSERDELNNQITCKICLTNKVDTLFLTCRHFVTCKSCADRVKDCPICRQIILGTVDVFMC